MILYLPPKAQRLPLCFVTDYRLGSDLKADEHLAEIDRPSDHVSVLQFYKPARRALTPYLYSRCPRIALFEAGHKPTSEERKAARAALMDALQDIAPRVIAVIPNETGGEQSLGDTVCWRVFNAPDAASQMRGTFFAWAKDSLVCPLHASSPWAKQLTHWQQDRFIKRCLAVAEGRQDIVRCPYKIIMPNEDMLATLQGMGRWRQDLAVDIESIESTGIITAIGVSDGVRGVSVPWDSFTPTGENKPERGLRDYLLGDAIEAALRLLLHEAHTIYFHNHTFDVPRLEEEGFKFRGRIEDTFAAHSIAFPELRHGLQFACADMLPIPPWKSAWHPKGTGFTRDDEEFWSCDPLALRDYNADDAFYTYHLAQQVMPCVAED